MGCLPRLRPRQAMGPMGVGLLPRLPLGLEGGRPRYLGGDGHGRPDTGVTPGGGERLCWAGRCSICPPILGASLLFLVHSGTPGVLE
jgi:hypothetical protein